MCRKPRVDVLRSNAMNKRKNPLLITVMNPLTVENTSTTSCSKQGSPSYGPRIQDTKHYKVIFAKQQRGDMVAKTQSSEIGGRGRGGRGR